MKGNYSDINIGQSNLPAEYQPRAGPHGKKNPMSNYTSKTNQSQILKSNDFPRVGQEKMETSSV